MKQLSREDACTPEALMEIMAEGTGAVRSIVSYKMRTLHKYYTELLDAEQPFDIILMRYNSESMPIK